MFCLLKRIIDLHSMHIDANNPASLVCFPSKLWCNPLDHIIVKLRVRVRVKVKVKVRVKSQKSKLDPEVGSVMG